MPVVFNSKAEFPYFAPLTFYSAKWDTPDFIVWFRSWERRNEWFNALKSLEQKEGPALSALPEPWRDLVSQLAAMSLQELQAIEATDHRPVLSPHRKIWVLFIPLAMIGMMAILLYTFHLLDEPAYLARSSGYYLVIAVSCALLMLRPEATSAVCRYSFVKYGSTLPVNTVLYTIPAQVSSRRHLYESAWYNALATGLTVLLVFWVQVWPYFRNWLRTHGPTRSRLPNVDPVSEAAPVFECLRKIEDPFIEFSAEVARCNFDFILTDQTSLVVGLWFPYMLEILQMPLDADARKTRSDERSSLRWYSEVEQVRSVETYVKCTLIALFVVLGIANLVGLILRRQYGSVGQTIFALFSVGAMFARMTLKDGVSLNQVCIYGLPHIGFMLVSFLAVTLPLLIWPDWFDGNSNTLAWTLVATVFYFGFLAGYLPILARCFSSWLRKNLSTPGEELEVSV